jgi:uncharacterized protein YbjT (DUF2867 family)
MGSDDGPVLVVGATGFPGRRLVAALSQGGRRVRCMARTPERAADLIGAPRVPPGAISGFVGEGPQADMIDDPSALRDVLGRSDRPYREAIEGQVL